MAGIKGTKDMASERVSLKIFANDNDEVVTFHLHPTMYLGNRRYDYLRTEQKHHDFKVLPNNQIDLKNVKVVTGQDKYHLLLPMDNRKGRKDE